jgi:hypothetical protein
VSYSQIEHGTGELVTYPDEFAGLTQDDHAAAEELQQEVLHYKGQVEANVLRMGMALINFRDAEAYKALGYGSFKLWCQSPEVDISVQQATYLTRIVEELLPRLIAAGVEPLTSVSKMRELLPMLSEGGDVAEAAEAIRDLKVLDAKEVVREMRGLEETALDPAVFKAEVTSTGGEWNYLDIVCYDDAKNDAYSMGQLRIKAKHMARWTERFGRFIEYN